MACTEDDLKPLAKQAFQYLEEQWPSFGIYWQLGHSFDTIVDYFLLGPEYAQDAESFAMTAVDAYIRSGTGPRGIAPDDSSLCEPGTNCSSPDGYMTKNNACWYDDFGWWGLSALKASQHTDLFGDATSTLKSISDTCWQMMKQNASCVWENNKGNPLFQVLEPRFPGGVWNSDWTAADGCYRTMQCPQIPDQDPAKNCRIPEGYCQGGDDLQGIQNTVTNGLYFVLATRLNETTQSDNEYNFLNSWFNVSDPTTSLLNRVQGGALVRERMPTYGSKFGTNYVPVCGYRPGLAWAGDQGLILGGLVDRMHMVGANSPEYPTLLQLSKDIVTGVRSQIDTHHKGILSAWVTDTQGGDFADYSTGVGVYWRYLLYAYQNNADLREFLIQEKYGDFVCDNASHISNGSLDIDKAPVTWGPGTVINPVITDDNGNREVANAVVALTNDLALLGTAIVMCRPTTN